MPFILTYDHNYEGWDMSSESYVDYDDFDEALKAYKDSISKPDEYRDVSLSVVILPTDRW